MLGRATCDLDSQDLPWLGLGGSHHLPPYSILCGYPQGPHPNGFLSRDSQVPRLGLLQLWGTITLRSDLWWKWPMKKICSPCRELSNSMSHATYTQGNWVDSRLLMVKSQIGNLTLGPPFGHNLCFRCSNGWCKLILDIFVPRSFQRYKKLFKPLSFDPYNCPLKIWEFTGTPSPKVGVFLGVWGFIPSHSFALPGACGMTPEFFSWPATLQALCLGCKPKARVATCIVDV